MTDVKDNPGPVVLLPSSANDCQSGLLAACVSAKGLNAVRKGSMRAQGVHTRPTD